jgi:hypothetical protein
MTTVDLSLIHTVTVREHFSAALQSAARNQDVALRDNTSTYLVNLLTDYCEASALAAVTDSNQQIKPLATLYGEALEAPTSEHRRRTLQKLGDLALFIAGIFSDSLNRKLVDVDYYIGMGEAAYCCVYDSLQVDARARSASGVFAELSSKFPLLVDLLTEISEMSGLKSRSDLLRTYELWQKTGSERARKQLRRAGIVPFVSRVGISH